MPDQPAASFQPAHTRILVVEDDEQFRLSVKRALELDGNQVSLFADAESALESLAAVAPSVILTDLRLPFADGLFLLDRVREKEPDLPVVLMTGHGDIPTAIQAIRAGVYDFLEKPFSRERLLAVIQRASDQASRMSATWVAPRDTTIDAANVAMTCSAAMDIVLLPALSRAARIRWDYSRLQRSSCWKVVMLFLALRSPW